MLAPVPPYSTVVGVPGRVVKRHNQSVPQAELNQTDLPDPVKEDIATLRHTNAELINRLLELEEEVRQLKGMIQTENN